MSETPIIDALIARAIEVCKTTDVATDPLSGEVQAPMSAAWALHPGMDELIQTTEKAFDLLHELVDNYEDQLSFGGGSGSTLVEFVHSLVIFADDSIFRDRIIAGVPDYEELAARRVQEFDSLHA